MERVVLNKNENIINAAGYFLKIAKINYRTKHYRLNCSVLNIINAAGYFLKIAKINYRTKHYRLNCSVLNEFTCFMRIKKTCLSSMYFSQILTNINSQREKPICPNRKN